jgi:hypothetical protein
MTKGKRRASRTFERTAQDRGSSDIPRSVISLAGLISARLQILPEQKNLPKAQASTRSEFGPFIAIVP